MAITSVGYSGQVTEADWPVLAWTLVGSYSVAGVNDFKVTPTTGDRVVAVADGVAVGAGVMDTGTSLSTVSIPAASSGSVWHLIALRRNWGTGASSIVRVEGSATKAIPAGREATPGTLDDQPLALVRVAAGSTVIQEVVDLRVMVADGGAFAFDDMALSYLNRVGTHVRIGDVMWFRSVDNTGVAVWRRLDVTADSGWTPLGYGSSDWNPSPSYPTRYRVAGGMVHLGFFASRGPWAAGTVATTLPVGARPSAVVYATAWWGPVSFPAEVWPDGAVRLPLAGTNGMSLTVSFPLG